MAPDEGIEPSLMDLESTVLAAELIRLKEESLISIDLFYVGLFLITISGRSTDERLNDLIFQVSLVHSLNNYNIS